MDDLRIAKQVFKGLTSKELRKRRATLRGAYEWCLLFSCKFSVCEKEIATIAEYEKRLAEQKWEEALAKVGRTSAEDYFEAEILLGSWGYYPPHFIYHSMCRTCGPVLSPYPNIKKIEDCIFCKSGFTQLMQSERERIVNEKDTAVFSEATV